MPSMRPSQYAMLQRSDDGPFLRFERDDYLLELEADEPSPHQADDGFEPEEDVKDYGISRVYYSDVPLEDDSPNWHLILEVTSEDLTIYPIYPRAGHVRYGRPKYGNIKSIRITRPVRWPYSHPIHQDDVEVLLSMLPHGLTSDWRHGLGFLYEYRYIAQAVASIQGVRTIQLHGQDGRNDTLVKGDTYILGVDQFDRLRRQLDRLSQRHQRETAEDKKLVCYAGLLQKASPENYPARARRLPPDFLAKLAAQGAGPVRLSLKDQKQVAVLTQQNVPTLAKTARRSLFSLKSEIELVTLGELTGAFRKMLESNANESRWQRFLSENPFVLDMAFGYPVKKISDQPYVGGKNIRGQGGQYSDFLMAAKATGNLALIEIKHPQHSLLGKPYRNTFTPSHELSGSVAQVIDQRSVLQREILALSHDLEERVHAHAVAAIVIIGRNPSKVIEQRAFEQYRNGLKDVLVITFDEMLERLEGIHKALAPKPPVVLEPISDEDLPF